VALTRAEFDMLAALTARQGRVMSRDALLQTVSNREHAWSDRTVDVLIGRLRKKIEADPRNPRCIHTVHGVGYVFRAERC
jgi:two-component system torCAD operon response regulator TorR